MTLAISLPLPPSINHQYATVRGRRVLSKTGRDYKATISTHIMLHCQKTQIVSRYPKFHPIVVTLHFYFRTLLKRDLDGGLKIIQDGICEALGINDNRVTEIHLYKHVDRENPRVDCELSIEKRA
ncbi:MAG: hypothetical protein NPIRA04_04140 [Nitrospirales bacterium]|nr:MAG: hypothetical protein NPIRA04_04140 [Nitrospirales bacterium]